MGGMPWRRARVVATLHRRRLVYRGRWQVAVAASVVVAAGIIVAAIAGQGDLATVPVAVAAAWLIYAMRIQRSAVGGGGDGPGPAPGAGVREPRRPLPKSPAGVAERSVPTF
jgi:hypothetical protein